MGWSHTENMLDQSQEGALSSVVRVKRDVIKPSDSSKSARLTCTTRPPTPVPQQRDGSAPVAQTPLANMGFSQGSQAALAGQLPEWCCQHLAKNFMDEPTSVVRAAVNIISCFFSWACEMEMTCSRNVQPSWRELLVLGDEVVGP